MTSPSISFNNALCKIDNVSYPPLGFGTYPLKGKECQQAVELAFNSGYRIFDTAAYYQNFDALKAAFATCQRQDCYLISKVWHDSLTPQDLQKDLHSTLKSLNTDYLDAYLIHWPNSQVPIEITLSAMETLKKQGKVRHLGLSNVTVNHLKKAVQLNVPLSWIQVEMHPFFYDKPLLEFCQQNALIIQAWRPLNLGYVQQDPLLQALANKYRKTPCQIALRWILELNALPLPSSKKKAHIQENFQIFDFSLTKEDCSQISQRAAQGKRFRLSKERGLGFTDEFDFSYEQCWPTS